MKKILLIIILIIAVGFSVFDYRVSTLKTLNGASQDFVIGSGESLFVIGEKLEDERLISSRIYYYYYAWKKKLRGQIKEGDYIVPAHATFAEMTQMFIAGESKVVKKVEIEVQLTEGFTAQEMAEELTEKGLPGNEFLVLVLTPPAEIIDAYDFLEGRTSLEGYLFPDTYKFFPEATAQEIIDKLLVNFDLKVTPQMSADIAASERTLHEVIILASVVEGEVNEGLDRGIVAGIFQNRLDIDMALESDATIDFVKGVPEIKHTLEDTKIDSPYNTYLYPGLPPGPINSPSLASIVAVINPTETDYLFFLNHAETGETVFAETFEQHIANKANNGL